MAMRSRDIFISCSRTVLGIAITGICVCARAEVIFERAIPEEVLKAHDLNHVNRYFEERISEEELQREIEKAKAGCQKEESIVRLELLFNAQDGNRPYFRTTSLGRNREGAKRQQAWLARAIERLAIQAPVGKSVPTRKPGGGLTDSGYLFFEGIRDARGELGYLRENFRGPERQSITVEFWEVYGHVIDHHQFLRNPIRNECRVLKHKFGTVVATRDRWKQTSTDGKGQSVFWLHGEGLLIQIWALAPLPDDLVEEVGRRFPSSLPKDFAIDKTAWGREEGRYWLGRMEKVLATGDTAKPGRQNDYSFFLENLKMYIFVPGVEGVIMHEATLEQKKGQFARLKEWWKENESKTEWHESMQRLAARGQFPEDLEREAKEQAEKRVRDILDAPLTDADVEALKERLIKKFELEMKEQLENDRAKVGADKVDFEKEGGKWTLIRRDFPGGVPYRWEYTGLKIRRRLFDKKRPLEATFTETVFEGAKGKTATSERAYLYYRLEDAWSRNVK